MPYVVSYLAARALLDARAARRETVDVSLDLNLTRTAVTLTPDAVALPDGERLEWRTLEEMAGSETGCWVVRDSAVEKVQRFSESLGRFYSLLPTGGAPTMLLSGHPMHRIKDIDPWEDTQRKLRTIAPLAGEVLDVCTGLGYTAIAAARSERVSRVTTIELDPTALEMCRLNPWSHELFDNPRITQLVGNAADLVTTLQGDAFSRIFHDPPAFSLAGELYSGAVYRELYRLVKRGGRLFHYIGDLDSTTGRVVAKGVVKRLQAAGFGRITRRPEAFGVTCEK